MSKFGRQSDQILRPWTLDENFDQVIAQQCDELEKSLRRTSPFKQGGDYSYIQQRRFDNTDAVLAERFTPPSKIPAHIDLKPIKSKSTPKNIANDAASPNLLPYVAKYSPPSTLEQSTAKASKLGEASKHEEKQQMETRILNDHRNSYAVSNYTIPNEMIKSADLSLTTTFSATSRVKEIANHRHNNEIEDNLRMYSTMPPIASPELTESSSISGIVTKTKSMPNLMDFSSAVLDGIQDRERRADMYSTKRRELINHIHPSSPGEVNHEFYTQNLNQSQKGRDTLMNYCTAPHTPIMV